LTKLLLFLLNKFAQNNPDWEYKFKFFFGDSEVFQDLIQEWACHTANKIYLYLTNLSSMDEYTEDDYQIVNLIANILIIILQISFITATLSFTF